MKAIQRDMANGQGFAVSLFGKNPTKNDIQYLTDFQNQLKKGVPVGQAWNNTMTNASVAGKKAAIQIKQGTTNLAELQQGLLSTKIATVGLQAASMALNMALSMGIAFAISKLVTVISNSYNKFDNLAEKIGVVTQKYKDAQDTIKSHKETIDSISGRYMELSGGVNALGENVGLTTDEFKEYNSICNQIADMYPSLVEGHTAEGNAILSLKGNIEGLTKAYREEIKAANDAVLVTGIDIDKAFEKVEANANGESYNWKDRVNRVKAYFGDGLEIEKSTQEFLSLIIDSPNMEETIRGMDYTSGVQKILKSTLKNLGIDLGDYKGETFADKIVAIFKEPAAYQKIKAGVDQFNTEFASAVEPMKSYLNAYLGNQLLDDESVASGLSEGMQGIIRKMFNNIDYQTLIDNNIHNTTDLVAWANGMIDSLSSVDNEQVTAFLEIQTKYNNDQCTAEQYDRAVHSFKDAISTLGEDAQKQIIAAVDLDDDDFVSKYNKVLKTIQSSSLYKKGQGLDEWMRSLTKSELDIAYQLSLDEETAYWDLQTWKDKVRSEGVIKVALNFDAKATEESFANIQKAIQESLKNTSGVTEESRNNLFAIYGDVPDLFDRTATGIRLNTNRLKELQDQQKELQDGEFKEALSDLYTQYEDLSSQIINNTNLSDEEYDALVEKRNAVVDNINALSDYISEYEGLTSAYAEWQAALANGEDGDMYDSIRTEYEKAKELFDKNLVGTSEFESYMKLLTGKDWSNASFDEIKKGWIDLDKEIKNTGYSVKDFLGDNEQGVMNFLNAAAKINGSGVTKKNGLFSIDIDNTAALAEKLGVSVDFVESMLTKLRDYKFNIDFKSETESLEKLTTTAQEASENLRALKLTDVKFDFTTTNDESLTSQLEEAKRLFDSIKNEDGTINMKADGASDIITVYKRLLTQKQQLDSPIVMDVDISKIEDTDIAEDIKEIQDYIGIHNKIQVEAALGHDTTELQNQLAEKLKAISKDNKILAGLDIDEKTSYEDIVAKVDEWSKNPDNTKILVGAGIDESRLDQEAEKVREYIQNAVDGIQIKLDFDNKYLQGLFGGTITINADTSDADSKLDNTQAKKDKVSQGTKTTVTADTSDADSKLDVTKSKEDEVGKGAKAVVTADTSSASSKLSTIVGYLRTIIGRVWNASVTTTGDHELNGTTGGKAKANGDIGAKQTEIALMGEIAPELWVHADTGTWELVDKPQFRKVKKGDVIFNGNQTKQLLKQGIIDSYGKSFLGGTAYNPGTGVDGSGTDLTGSNSSSSSSTSSGNNSDSRDKNKDKTDKVLEDFKKWFSKWVDWVEIKLERQTDKINKYVKRADKALDSRNYNGAKTNYNNAINETKEQIRNQQLGANEYQSQANSVRNKAIKDGIVSKKNADKIISKIKDGTIDITKYSERQQEFIKDYQQYYDKSVECRQAVADLTEETKRYAKAITEIPLEKASRDIDNYSHKIDILKAKQEATTSTSTSAFYTKSMNDYLTKENAANQTALATTNNRAKSLKESFSKESLSKISSKTTKKLLKNEKKTYNDIYEKVKSYINNDKSVPESVINKIESAISKSSNSTQIRLLTNLLTTVEKWNTNRGAQKQAKENAEISAIVTENEKKANLDAQRENEINKAQTRAGVRQSGFAYTTATKNSQINASNAALNAQDKAYDDATTAAGNNVSTMRGKAKNSVAKELKNKSLKKEYRQALNNAEAAMKAKKKVSSKDLSIIKKYNTVIYNKCVSYNTAYDNWETAKYEEAVNYASTSAERFSNTAQKYQNKDDKTNEDISLLEQKSENATSTSGKNKYIRKATKKVNQTLEDDVAEIKDYSNIVTSKKKTIGTSASKAHGSKYSGLDKSIKTEVDKYIKKAQDSAKKNEPIDTYVIDKLATYSSKGWVKESFYKACVDYNNALEHKKQAEAQFEIDKETTKAKLKANAQQKLSNIQEARNDKLNKIETSTKVGSSSYAYSLGGKNNQLIFANAQLKKQNKAYDASVIQANKEVNRSANALVTKNDKGVLDKELNSAKKNSKYKKALQNAKNAIKARKKVATEDLKEIKKHNVVLYNNILSYNYDIDNLEIANEEQAVNYAATSAEIYENIEKKYQNKDDKHQSNISLYQQRADNATSVKGKNKQLNKIITENNKILADDQEEIDTYAKDVTANKKTINNNNGHGSKYNNASSKVQEYVAKAIDKAKECAKKGVAIPPATLSNLEKYNAKGYVSDDFYKACVDYNNALEYKKQAEAQKEIDEETVKANNAAIGTQKVQNVEQKYQNKLNDNQVKKNQTATAQSLKQTRGLSLTKSDYNTLIKQSKEDQDIYEEEANAVYEQIQENLTSGIWTTDSQEYKDAMQSYEDYKNKAKECEVSQAEWNNAIANLPYDNLSKAVERIKTLGSYYKSIADLRKAQGKDLRKLDYTRQIEQNEGVVTKLAEERSQAWKDYQTALASEDGVYGGKTAKEWLQQYRELGTEINNTKIENEELKDSLRDDVYWRTFERAHDAAKRLSDVLSGINDLISDDMYFNSDGEMTDYGLLQLSLLVKEYDQASTEVSNYSKDIKNLNELYANGEYTAEEYKEKLNELETGMLSSASSMKSSMMEIVNIYKTLEQFELDSLNKLIDARKKALSAKKAYYDYDKTLKSKNKDIQLLTAQLAALEGVDGLEAKAKRAQLEAQLSDANDELNEIMMEHQLELSQDALDGLSKSMQEAFDDKWEDISNDLEALINLMDDANSLTAQSSTAILEALSGLFRFYGIDDSNIQTQIKNSAGYASGTKRITKDQMAWTQENGSEIIVRKSDGAILTPLSRGDGVIPHDLTENLYRWGMLSPEQFSDANNKLKMRALLENSNGVNITQHFGSLINVDGNVDSTVISDLESFAKQFYKGAYEYTTKAIVRDARKIGIK